MDRMIKPLTLKNGSDVFQVEFVHVTSMSIERYEKAWDAAKAECNDERANILAARIEENLHLLDCDQADCGREHLRLMKPVKHTRTTDDGNVIKTSYYRHSFNAVTFVRIVDMKNSQLYCEGASGCSKKENFCKAKGRQTACARALESWSPADRERFWSAFIAYWPVSKLRKVA